ncbi:MAG: hypothetical protein N3G20_09850 [Verrucomicrobiae bacterium]|nr:hypothetical protein [Verrucomicrobiae bacterium]
MEKVVENGLRTVVVTPLVSVSGTNQRPGEETATTLGVLYNDDLGMQAMVVAEGLGAGTRVRVCRNAPATNAIDEILLTGVPAELTLSRAVALLLAPQVQQLSLQPLTKARTTGLKRLLSRRLLLGLGRVVRRWRCVILVIQPCDRKRWCASCRSDGRACGHSLSGYNTEVRGYPE